ncbi:alpha/beta hydrolase-fold protein [Humibacter soli]
MDTLLNTQIIGGPVPWVLTALSAALGLVLVIRRVSPRWLILASSGVLAGAILSLVFVWIADATAMFEIPLPVKAAVWAVITFAAIGLAVVSLWKARWWQRVVAGAAIAVFAVTGIVHVNVAFDLDPTIGDLVGVVVRHPIALPNPVAAAASGAKPLAATWVAPRGMPAEGKTGTVTIPATVSKFDARDAGLYLPPAALVKNAPALPLVIMMMGYPGTPDAAPISSVMNAFAAKHHGLAPIVVVADQIGYGSDPGCADSSTLGHAATYIKTDVLDWARTHLRIIQNPKEWVIAGYSNGATCAVKFAAQEPDMFRNVLAVSPELFPGTHYSQTVLSNVYNGNVTAWNADKPPVILADHTGSPFYHGIHAVFTTGALDLAFGPQTRQLAADARAAGMGVSVLTLPGVAHVGANLTAGLTAGVAKLGPVLGLSSACTTCTLAAG